MNKGPAKKNSKRKPKGSSAKISKLKVAKKTLRIIGTTLLSVFLVIIITGSILSTALTVYVLKFMDNSSLVTLDDLNLSYATILYAKDKKGTDTPIYTLSGGNKCVWVDIEKVPQHVQDAFVFAEDARFYSHEGVDFKRTFAAFANYVFNFWGNTQGGSSITQQLVKNITHDDEQKADRKIREIFSALNMERNYTKTDILEAYMNITPFWYNMTGIQTAANFYFNKDVSQLTPAEAASIVAITKSPKYNNPIKYPENNKKRQQYILSQMYKYGSISSEEYEAALKEKLTFVGNNKVETADKPQTNNVSSYFVDAALDQAQQIIKDKYGLKDKTEALTKLRTNGYRVYTTENIDYQSTLEAKFKDPKTFSYRTLKDPPQAATVMMDYKGNVLGIVGGIGEKTESLGFNRATDAERSPGSCIKPLASYGPAIEMNRIHWSSTMIDQPLQVFNPKTGKEEDFTWTNEKGEKKTWPQNYEKNYTHASNFTYFYLQHSKNTAAAYLIEDIVTPKGAYDFLKNNFHLSSLIASDIDRAPMALGALGHGTKLIELVAAYQAFGNLGKYYSPTFITKITDAEGNIIYDHQYKLQKALSSDTAYVMNRLMKRVVDHGTAVGANNGLNNIELVGKTGTSMDNNDLLFVGCSPDYVAGIWYGYDKLKDTSNTYYLSPKVWNNTYRSIFNTGTKKSFTADPNVEAIKFCKKTGLLAGPNCTDVDTGYYKKSYKPARCPGDH